MDEQKGLYTLEKVKVEYPSKQGLNYLLKITTFI